MSGGWGADLKDRINGLKQERVAGALRKEAKGLSVAAVDALLERISRKTLIFTVSSGRAGTASLAEIFGALPGVAAVHEAEPAFHDVMRGAMLDPALAHDFLLTRKLPAIAAHDEPVYFESSHLFGKGFVAPMLRLGVRPHVLFLKRDPRSVALSLERIGATPFRTRRGQHFLISPADPSLLPMLGWEDFTDYQLCYWYALENIRRQRVLHNMVTEAGCLARYLRIEDLRRPADVEALLAAMAIPGRWNEETRAALASRLGAVVNRKDGHPPKAHKLAELAAQERTVIARIQACLPELDLARMVASYIETPALIEPVVRPAPLKAGGSSRLLDGLHA